MGIYVPKFLHWKSNAAACGFIALRGGFSEQHPVHAVGKVVGVKRLVQPRPKVCGNHGCPNLRKYGVCARPDKTLDEQRLLDGAARTPG